jgi:homoserine kinase type II
VRRKYFLRRYKSGILPEEIQFEHGLIEHLLDKKFDLVAKIHKTKTGATYLERPGQDSPGQVLYYTIFDFLPGEDRYTWIDPNCSPEEVENCAAILARYHDSVSGFNPPGRRSEPKIIDLLPRLAGLLRSSPKRSKGSQFDTYLVENLELLVDNCLQIQAACGDFSAGDYPELVVHGDFHPGNLKFEGAEVVALFDFDWSKIDLRGYDLGLGLWYFFTRWKAPQDGVLRTEEGRKFLNRYQKEAAALPNLKPLTGAELDHLPQLINLGNLYVLYWLVVDFYAKPVDVQEYLGYLRHHVHFVQWLNSSGQTRMQEELRTDDN